MTTSRILVGHCKSFGSSEGEFKSSFFKFNCLVAGVISVT
jgi:hypothetical protein